MLLKHFILSLLLSLTLGALSRTTNKLWPKPLSFSYDTQGPSVSISPCNLKFTINADDLTSIQQIVAFYKSQVFGCGSQDPIKGQLVIGVVNGGQYIATEVKHEKYTLSMPKAGKWTLKADYYVGFLRGFQTFSQLFENQGDGSSKISGLPIAISDGPQYIWRGLMIDTSRHFLDVATIKRILDAMLYMKLNILHWHIIDEDSFPMEIPNAPQFSQFGKIGGTFTYADIRSVIAYARLRGIRVVPQVDTPAHTDSWSRSPKYSAITLNCNGKYMGQFDPTIDLTWQAVTEVLSYVNDTFDDDYVHFGGDEVLLSCWDQRPSIKAFMEQNGILDYQGLQIYYRQKQKQLFRESVSKTKKVIYWANEQIDLPVQDEDVIHWWGDQANQGKLSGRKSQVILSNYDLVYLDTGFNNIYGINYGVYKTWRVMYAFNPAIPDANVIGGTTCMWNEIGTKHTFEQKVLQKASVLAERLWNTNISLESELNNIATRLQAQAVRLRARGYKVWPVTVELCQKNMQICF